MLNSTLVKQILDEHGDNLISESLEEVIMLFDNRFGVRLSNKKYLTNGNQLDVIEISHVSDEWHLVGIGDEHLIDEDVLDWIRAVKDTEWAMY